LFEYVGAHKLFNCSNPEIARKLNIRVGTAWKFSNRSPTKKANVLLFKR